MEVEIMIVRDGSTLSPAPTPTSTGVLESIERIPRARSSSGRFREEELYQTKDNDISTSWTCDGSTTRNGDCEIELDLSWYRHLKQVKIVARDVYVTSSGTTTDFETYEFDVFTDRIIISSHVGSDGSISIAEVEFVQEVQAGEIPVILFRPPFESEASSIDNVVPNGFEWWSESEEALDEELQFKLSTWASLTAVVLKFPTNKTYLFDLHLYTEADGGDEPFTTLTGLESEDTAGWQTFDVQLDVDQTVTEVRLVMTGTGSGASGFHLRDAGFMGTRADNPTDTYYVSTTRSPFRNNPLYPDFVGDGKSDQEAIMGAICALKKAPFDGVDCVGEDPAATGTVLWVSTGHIGADVVQLDAAAELGRNPITLPVGNYFVDGNIFMKSGVILDGDTSEEDPNRTTILLADGAAGNTAIDAIIVFDGVTDAVIDEVWVEGLYDPESSNAISAVAGLGSTAISITNCQSILHNKGWVGSMDGDAIVVRDSQTVSLDAGRFKEENQSISVFYNPSRCLGLATLVPEMGREFVPDRIASSRGIGLLVDASKDVYVRRHAIFDNGGAGIHIVDTTNFTFDATIGRGYEEGQGYVGSLDGQQPIEVIVESSHGVIFQDMSVRSANDPVMTVSADSSEVMLNNNGFSNVDAGTCVIQAEDPSVVTIEDDELMLVDSCYVKA